MKTDQSTRMYVTGTAGSDKATIFVSVHYTLHIQLTVLIHILLLNLQLNTITVVL